MAEDFDLVVAAGNIFPLLAAGTEPTVVTRLAETLRPGGLMVAGFGLDEAHLPVPPSITLPEYDAYCTAAGLTFVDRFATAMTGITWLLISTLAPAGSSPAVVASFVVIGIVAAWVVVIVGVRKQYLRAFRHALPGPNEDRELLQYGMGVTNVVARPTRAAAARPGDRPRP